MDKRHMLTLHRCIGITSRPPLFSGTRKANLVLRHFVFALLCDAKKVMCDGLGTNRLAYFLDSYVNRFNCE